MLGMLVASVVALQGSANVAEFYPLKPGIKWTYITSPGSVESSDKVLQETTLVGKLATPVLTTTRGQSVGETFYRIEGDTVLVVAFGKDQILPDPHPIVRIPKDGKSLTWRYAGTSPFMRGSDSFEFTATSTLLGSKEVLGKQCEVLEVKMDATLAGNEDYRVKIKQTSRYAKGVGLYEMEEESTVGARKSNRTVKLVNFESP
jgi:hypothetical protein